MNEQEEIRRDVAKLLAFQSLKDEDREQFSTEEKVWQWIVRENFVDELLTKADEVLQRLADRHIIKEQGMSKQEEIREGTVIRFLARDEGVSIEDAMDYWGRWLAELKKNPEHFGDCTKEPQTCNRCLIEGYYREVDNFLKWQSEQGVVIKEPLIRE